jgi:DNA modification methylase
MTNIVDLKETSPLSYLDHFIPPSIDHKLLTQSHYPQIAKTPELCAELEQATQGIPTTHRLVLGDSRNLLSRLTARSVHLIVTSPPYWNLKQYPARDGQLGCTASYEHFVSELARVWKECYRVLVPGGRLVIIVGDVSVRRRVYGRHLTFPLHASIQERCRRVGFDNLTPIIWHKYANATYEANGRGGGFLGKPYEPNALVKNDIEFILLQRKPGDNGQREYRKPTVAQRILSLIPEDKHRKWFQSIWQLRGESLRHHPAPFPLELAERLVRMFSFVGDIVLDPFSGTGTTLLAAGKWGRNGIGIEIEPKYHEYAHFRLISSLSRATITTKL